MSISEITLEFEKPIAELQAKILELRKLSGDQSLNIDDQLTELQERRDQLLVETYKSLEPWQKTQVARHPRRPHFLDYVGQLVDDYIQLSGDRAYADDQALLGGMGRIGGYAVMVIGQERGHDMDSRVKHNFGMTRPEGYRKAIRLMELAERYQIPVVTFVDTAGAYPGVGAEQRGQAEAIAQSIKTCLSLTVPVISVVIGEGGSGGAIAIATANKVLMLEHAVYSVISPEGCASILWRDKAYAKDAANALKITAQSLLELGVIDSIIDEPLGGAHRQRWQTIESVGDALKETLEQMVPAEGGYDGAALRSQRRDKFLAIGRLDQNAAA